MVIGNSDLPRYQKIETRRSKIKLQEVQLSKIERLKIHKKRLRN